MIEIQSVSKYFGRKCAVDRLNLTVNAGEVFAFLGPNGAGKTTTIKMIVGLLRPTEGRILVCGRDVTGSDVEAKALLSYVPDQPYLYEKLTGREFLQFIADIYRMPKREGEARIEEAIATYELDEFVDQLTGSYSHGMKQRVVVAGAFLHEPRVAVIDEPMVGLDPRSSRIVKDMLRGKARAGATVFMSTHTLSIAEEIADRIGIIDRGQLVTLGSAEELRAFARVDGRLEDVFLAITEGADVRP
jgi:ABC-2 type transport system ATP-binding protein